jgi:hypothetical protein
MPDDLSWREQCVALQREGVKFERNESGIFVHDSVCYAFNLSKEKYRRVDGQPMPEDITWQSQARKMQSEGYVFSYESSWGEAQIIERLSFSEARDKYTVVSAPVVS